MWHRSLTGFIWVALLSSLSDAVCTWDRSEVFYPLFSLIFGQGGITALTDLRPATPLTIIETYSDFASDCVASPFAQTQIRTLYHRNTGYPGNVISVTMQTGTSAVSYVFPNLFLTLLLPGDLVTQVSSNLSSTLPFSAFS